jgi:hypothetical protein
VGIRETLNQNPGITTGVTAGIVVIALGFIIWQLTGSDTPDVPNEMFYSDDDGKTHFADAIDKVPPYDHNGKQAVRARVYKCGSGQPFVAYLERYSKDAKEKIEKAKGNKAGDAGMAEEIAMTGIEVKKPGDKDWVRQLDPRSAKIMEVKCPDGSTTNLEPVMPD